MISSLLQDVRYAARRLARTPGFTCIAVVVLAVGIAGVATIFSLINTLFLRPLPIDDPSTIVRVYSNRYSNTPYRTFVELRDRTPAFGIASRL